jgi:hypothetical protein
LLRGFANLRIGLAAVEQTLDSFAPVADPCYFDKTEGLHSLPLLYQVQVLNVKITNVMQQFQELQQSLPDRTMQCPDGYFPF